MPQHERRRASLENPSLMEEKLTRNPSRNALRLLWLPSLLGG